MWVEIKVDICNLKIALSRTYFLVENISYLKIQISYFKEHEEENNCTRYPDEVAECLSLVTGARFSVEIVIIARAFEFIEKVTDK